MIADTVSVAKGGDAPEVLTAGVTKALKDIAYQINDDDDDEDAAKDEKKAKAATVAEGGVVLDAKTRTSRAGPPTRTRAVASRRRWQTRRIVRRTRASSGRRTPSWTARSTAPRLISWRTRT